MRLFREYSLRDALGVRTPTDPTTLTVATSTVAGVPIETLVGQSDGAMGRWYVDTTDASYVANTTYRIAWTATLAGNTFTRTLRFRQASASGGTAPGPASITLNSFTVTTVTLNHTPPTDADYASTTVYAISLPGGIVATATGTGATITVPGLSGATHYIFVAVATDTSGNRSAIGTASVCECTTAVDTAPAMPLIVKWFVDDEDTIHEFGPEYLDPTDAGSHRITNLGRGRLLRVRLECHAPVATLQIRSIGLIVQTRERRIGGLRGSLGDGS